MERIDVVNFFLSIDSGERSKLNNPKRTKPIQSIAIML